MSKEAATVCSAAASGFMQSLILLVLWALYISMGNSNYPWGNSIALGVVFPVV
jgi:hypothetical protein